MGVATYNAECRKIVSRYSVQWEVQRTNELGCINSSHLFFPNSRKLCLEWEGGLTSRMITRQCIPGSWKAYG